MEITRVDIIVVNKDGSQYSTSMAYVQTMQFQATREFLPVPDRFGWITLQPTGVADMTLVARGLLIHE